VARSVPPILDATAGGARHRTGAGAPPAAPRAIRRRWEQGIM